MHGPRVSTLELSIEDGSDAPLTFSRAELSLPSPTFKTTKATDSRLSWPTATAANAAVNAKPTTSVSTDTASSRQERNDA